MEKKFYSVILTVRTECSHELHSILVRATDEESACAKAKSCYYEKMASEGDFVENVFAFSRFEEDDENYLIIY
jgi:DNA-directed RNA polymerase subunit M/transcription elongation factor TFIIS